MAFQNICAKITDAFYLITHKRITADQDVNDVLLKTITFMPTHLLPTLIDDAFWKKLDKQDYMRVATFMAEKSYNEGGCPIGAVIVCRDTGRILGKGHNRLVQDNDPTVHGETAAIKDAGRIHFSNTDIYTTLTPCYDMCRPTINRLGFASVYIGYDLHGANKASEDWLKEQNIHVEIIPDQKYIDIYDRFCREKPHLNHEDWKNLTEADKEFGSAQH